MPLFQEFLRKVRKAETPFYANIKRIVRAASVFELPSGGPLRGAWSFFYHLWFLVPEFLRRLAVLLWRGPMFRSQCARVGKRLYIERIPWISGHVRLILGDGVRISGKIDILAGRVFEEPEIILGDGVFLGHGITLQVAQRIELEEGAALAGGCYVSDNDAHPIDAAARLRGEPPPPGEVLPVRIGRYAWVGRGSSVLKGVTIGEFAIVGVGSVVSTDVPPFSIAMGNPARVVKRLPIPEGWRPDTGKPGI